jgi:hypothetical protein
MADGQLIFGMTDEDYFADPCEAPSLNPSTAKTIVGRSPAHAYLEHPRLGGSRREPSKAMDFGSLVDVMLLGGVERIELIDAKNYQTKVAQESRDAAREAGKLPALPHEFKRAQAAVASIKSRLGKEFGIHLTGERQVSAFWTEETSNGDPVQCRGRMDLWDEPTITIDDVKVIHCAKPKTCIKQIVELGYEIQGWAYKRAVEKACPGYTGRVRFRNIFVEATEPFCVTPIEHSESLQHLGRMRWERAIDTWHECLKANNWPTYTTHVIQASAPPWALNEELENHANL